MDQRGRDQSGKRTAVGTQVVLLAPPDVVAGGQHAGGVGAVLLGVLRAGQLPGAGAGQLVRAAIDHGREGGVGLHVDTVPVHDGHSERGVLEQRLELLADGLLGRPGLLGGLDGGLQARRRTVRLQQRRRDLAQGPQCLGLSGRQLHRGVTQRADRAEGEALGSHQRHAGVGTDVG